MLVGRGRIGLGVGRVWRRSPVFLVIRCVWIRAGLCIGCYDGCRTRDWLADSVPGFIVAVRIRSSVDGRVLVDLVILVLWLRFVLKVERLERWQSKVAVGHVLLLLLLLLLVWMALVVG